MLVRALKLSTGPTKDVQILGECNYRVCLRQSNPDISNFMKKWNMTNDYHKLESIYIKKLLDIVSSYPTNNGYIVWQEVFDNGVAVKNDTVIHVWKVRVQTFS